MTRYKGFDAEFKEYVKRVVKTRRDWEHKVRSFEKEYARRVQVT